MAAQRNHDRSGILTSDLWWIEAVTMDSVIKIGERVVIKGVLLCVRTI